MTAEAGGTTTRAGRTPLDATDRALIALLKENARTPVADLARKVGLSRTTVQSRLERLERSGVIARYTVVLADELEAGAIRAHILVSAPTRAAGWQQCQRSARQGPEGRCARREIEGSDCQTPHPLKAWTQTTRPTGKGCAVSSWSETGD